MYHVSRPKIAVAGCRRLDDGDPADLYPDPDAAPLRSALRKLGVESRLVSWDDPNVEWATFSHIVVSSTWDSVDRPEEYVAWAQRVSAVTKLVNDVSVIQWNLDKVYLRELEAAGVPVIPTRWVAPAESWELPAAADFVVKPSVSAGGRSTARYRRGDTAADVHVQSLQRVGQTVMVQEYLSAIDVEGECDLIFVDGEFTHAVLKKPALVPGKGVVERPWERMAWAGLVEPSPEQMAVGARTIEVVSRSVEQIPGFGRVDLVSGSHGQSLVLEVELIDPYLSLDMHHGAAAKLAATLIQS
jgi:glutathione synthase/RimK-type ligase-like ATP-grasp enzyme